MEPLVPVTTITPLPDVADEEATIESTAVVTVEETLTVDGLVEHEIPVKEDESQPKLMVPVNPPVPYTIQLRVVVDDLVGSAGMLNWSSSQSSSKPGPASGMAELHCDDGPKHASFGPFGITM